MNKLNLAMTRHEKENQMKKWLVFIGLLLGVSVASFAGIPIGNNYLGQSPLSNTSIYGSSNTVTTIGITLTPPTFNSGGLTQQCRNCFTRLAGSLTAGASYYVLDGGTTVQFVLGAGIASTGGLFSYPEDSGTPLCFSSGQVTSIKVLGATTPSSFVNYEGYTNCGGTNNAGPMQ